MEWSADRIHPRTDAVAPLRSALFVPGIRPGMLEKARAAQADAIWIDLEDSVPLPEKVAARDLVASAIPTFGDKHLYVRINGLATALAIDDLSAIAQRGLAGVLVPKVDSVDDVRIVEYLLYATERHKGLPEGQIRIGVTIETAKGAAHCREILSASSRIALVLVGIAQDGDMQRELGYKWSPRGLEMLYVRSKVLLEGRAAGIATLMEGPYVAFKDDEGLRSEAEDGRRLGYTGKAAIHPRQLEIINETFSPDPEEVEYFRRVVTAMEDAYSHGLATGSLDGKMIDTAMLLRARQVLGQADASSSSKTERASFGDSG